MEYIPLNQDSNEIRILTILPASSDGSIQTTISHLSLSSDSDYDALSYCWGDPSVKKTILVNGNDVEVTENLHAALHEFTLAGSHVRLWVDALCINQADPVERSQHVLRMREIYSSAGEVVVWLGDGGTSSNAGMEFIELLASDKPLVHQDRTNFDLAYTGMDNSVRGQFYPSWNGVIELFHRPYWLRTWIIQEFVVAERLKIQCGNLAVDFEQFYWAINRFERMRSEARRSVFAENDQYFVAVSQLLTLRKRRLVGIDMTMLTALEFSSASQATDIRDKIYGFLAMTRDGPSLIPKPDYTASFELILQRFTKSLVSCSEDRNFVFLRKPERSHRLGSNFPSWVPDLADLHWCFQRSLVVNRWYHAGGPYYSPPPVTFHSNDSVMKLHGHIFDTIDGLPCIPQRDLDHPVSPGRSASAYGSTNGTREAIWRSIFSNVNSATIQPAPDMWGLYFSSLWKNLRLESRLLDPEKLRFLNEWLRQHPDFSILGRPLSSWAESFRSTLVKTQTFLLQKLAFKGSQFVDDAQKEFLTQLVQEIESKRLAITGRGYVGMIHADTRKGDSVAVIPGFKMPVILRKRGEMWELIGEAYVHGIMNSEAVKDMDERDMTELLIC